MKKCSLSLKEEVRQKGVPIIESKAVREHKRAALAALRPGKWKFLGPLMKGVLYVCSILYLGNMYEGWMRRSLKNPPAWIVFLPVFLFVVGITMLISTGEWEWGIPILAFCVELGVSFSLRKNENFMQATSAWITWRVNIRGYGVGCMESVPAHLRERFNKVYGLANTHVCIEHMMDDPFLVVIRGHGPFAQKVYFGAWDTGVFDDI